MVVFPPAVAVAILVNGTRILAYERPYEAHGRIFAPVRPFVTQVADRVWFAGGCLLIERGSRIVRIRIPVRMPDALDRDYVPIAPILRALGEDVRYDATRRIVEVRGPKMPVDTPTPFNARAPQVAPTGVFTPTPVATPRPVWTGPAIPRRTPIPRSVPTPTP